MRIVASHFAYLKSDSSSAKPPAVGVRHEPPPPAGRSGLSAFGGSDERDEWVGVKPHSARSAAVLLACGFKLARYRGCDLGVMRADCANDGGERQGVCVRGHAISSFVVDDTLGLGAASLRQASYHPRHR